MTDADEKEYNNTVMKKYCKAPCTASKKFTKENLPYFITLNVALAFCLFSLLLFLLRGETDKAFMALVCIGYACLPDVGQRLLRFRMQKTTYMVVMLYTICPLLGYSYHFYYLLPWWDDLLHAFAGVLFAMLGAYLPKIMSKNGEASLSLCVFSAFFFSVAIAGLWEIVEFLLDGTFGTDMQKDTALFSMRPSYLLSELLGYPMGELAELKEAQIIVNGQIVDGYVDLGLLDTMKDIVVETLGAAVYTVAYRAGKGKLFAFTPLKNAFVEEEAQTEEEQAA